MPFLTPETLSASEVFAQQVYPTEITVFAVSKDLAEDTLNALVLKEVKGKGLLDLVMALPRALTLALLQALDRNYMSRQPFELLLSQEAARARSSPEYLTLGLTGTLFLAVPGSELSPQDSEAKYCQLKQLLNNTTQYSVFAISNCTEYLCLP